jgi:hypothetical protein
MTTPWSRITFTLARAVIALLMLLPATVAAFPAVAAHATLGAPVTSVFFDGEAGSYVIGDQQLTLTALTPGTRGNGVTFAMNQNGHTLQAWFGPPQGGAPLSVGTYENAVLYDLRDASHPGIDIFGDGKGCNAVSGRFIVDQITLAGDGTPTVFSARFEFHCEGGDAAVFGAISYNATADFRTIGYSASKLAFGAIGATSSSVLTETLTNGGPSDLTITKTAIGGANASAFTVTASTCQTLAPGASCSIDVRVAPGGVTGVLSGKLTIFDDEAPESGTGKDIVLSATSAPAPSAQGEFTPLTPARILDTRDGTGGFNSPVGPGQTINVQVVGVGGVPSSGVGSVVFNATAVNPSKAAYLTMWPTGIAQPDNSNINVKPGETRPNLVTVTVGAGGQVSVFNNAGTTDVIFDVVGFYSDGAGPAGSRFHGVNPFRLFDTRTGATGVPAAPIAQGGVLSVSVRGTGVVPPNATALIMNVTVTAPSTAGYVTVFPGDVGVPVASNLNFVAGETIPNLVTVRVPQDGIIKFFNSSGATHVIADIVGYYDTVRIGNAGRYIGVAPARILDTRLFNAPLGANEFGILPVVGRGNIPAGAAAAIMNITVTGTTSAGYLSVFPDDACTVPLVSNLNFMPGDSVPNLVVVRLSTSTGCAVEAGDVDVYNSAGTTDVISDVFGYFT